jgi:hypothetical protein
MDLIEILGFTSMFGIFWNLLAYIAMVLIIIAVLSEKYREGLFFWGPLILFLYALIYLQDPILTGLQLIISVSGVLNISYIKERLPKVTTFVVIIILTVIVFAVLLITGRFSNFWFWIGSFGLLGIALGLPQLPNKRGFAIMALGGLLIVIYAFALQIWVFFVLNIIFFIVNFREFLKKEEQK